MGSLRDSLKRCGAQPAGPLRDQEGLLAGTVLFHSGNQVFTRVPHPDLIVMAVVVEACAQRWPMLSAGPQAPPSWHRWRTHKPGSSALSLGRLRTWLVRRGVDPETHLVCHNDRPTLRSGFGLHPDGSPLARTAFP
jgi:hypothetical protein